MGRVKLFECEVETGFEPVYTALQAVASPLGHSTMTAHVTPSSGRRDSNPRPPPWQGDALPAALRPRAQQGSLGESKPYLTRVGLFQVVVGW